MLPTYVFRCQDCEHEFEVRTSWSKKNEVECPSCGGDSLKELLGKYRLMSAGAAAGSDSGGGGSCSSGFG